MKFSAFFPSSEENKREHNYEAYRLHSNLRTVRIVSAVLLVSHLVLFLLDFQLFRTGEWERVPAYRYLFWSHIFVFIIYIPMWFFSRKDRLENQQKIKIFLGLASIATVLWATSVSMIDQFIHQNISVFIMTTLVMATVIIYDRKERNGLFAFTIVVFFVSFSLIDIPKENKIAHLTNGSIFIFFSYIISTIISNYNARNFHHAQVIEKQNQRLQQYNEELKQFSYIVSHDLKAPLRTISSFVGLLDKSLVSKDTKQQEFMNFIEDGAKNMSNLIDDLLEFTTIDREVEMEDVSLEKVLLLVKNNLSMEIQQSEATIKLPSQLPNIQGIKPHMILLFQNLISNAIKYQSNELPLVEVSYKEKKNKLVFAVQDNGKGISADISQQVFQAFSRGNQENSQINGTGIGLAICKKIIKRVGGEIWVDSEIGKGSCFYFTIPNKESAA